MVSDRAAVVGLALLLAAAGCTGSQPAPAAISSQVPSVTAEPARFDESTGAIAGLVVDSELRPLAGAEVMLRETQATTRSDADGRFTFSNLAVMTYTLVVGYLGAESRAVAVEVFAGDVVTVEIALELLAVSSARSQTWQERGLLGCVVAMRLPTLSNGTVSCGSVQGQAVGENRHLITWPPMTVLANWSASVFEMDWRSTQALGRGLQGKLYLLPKGNCVWPSLVEFEGLGPLKGQANATNVQALLQMTNEKCPEVCSYDSCVLTSWVAGVPSLLGASAVTDVGFVYQQHFEQYHTAFFLQDPPVAFSALPDA